MGYNTSTIIVFAGVPLEVHGYYEKAHANDDGFPIPATLEINKIYQGNEDVYDLIAGLSKVQFIEALAIEKLKNK